MANTRREFLLAAAGGALGLGLGSRALAATMGAAAKSLNILFLGGTGFLGPHMVRRALARGHGVSIFSRGRSKTVLPDSVERLIGDRDGDLNALKGRSWDLVIDNSGYVPRLVRDSAELLRDSVGHYIFTSTVSVYFDPYSEGPPRLLGGLDIAEDAPLAAIKDATTEDVRKNYGPLKVLCENVVREVYPDRHSVIRPTFVAGPGDHTDRFTYWTVRIDRGGEMLAPGDPGRAASYIDVRDLAEFFVHVAETGAPGAYNCSGPASRLTWRELLTGMKSAIGGDARLVWVGEDFLAQRLGPRSRELPIWARVEGGPGGPRLFSNEKSVAAGLTYRPLAVTARDTLAWFKSLPEERRAGIKAGLSAAREAELLAAWHARKAP